MADPPAIVDSPALGIPPRGVPATDPAYKELAARGKLRPLGILNVADFGAIGDAAHDDYGAVQRALDTAKRDGAGAIYIPPGTYKCGSQLALTGSPFELFGAGRSQTVLEWAAAGGGIAVTQSVGGDRTIVRDLSLNTTASGGGTGLAITGPASPGNNHPIVQNVHLAGSGYWTKGIHLTNLMQARIEGVRISGNRSSTTHGIHLAGNCTDSLISRCHLDHVDRAIYVDGTTEGFVVHACPIVYVNRGIDVDQSAISAKAWAEISDCHINAYSWGVLLDNHVECLIHDNLIYRHPDGTGDFYGIQMVNLNDRSRITSNIINSLNTTGVRRGIQVAGRWILIADNIIRNCGDAVFLTSASADIFVHDNFRVGGTNTVVNNGTTPVRNIHHNGPEVRENRGHAVVVSGTTTITVTHGLSATPQQGDIQVTATNQPTNDPGHVRIVNVGATTFQINVRSNPGASGAGFDWFAHTLG